jgi:hypothetical protein
LLKSWKVVLLALDELALEAGRGDTKSKIIGVRKQMGKMKTYLGVLVCQALFGPCEDLAKALQAENTTATGSLQASKVLLTHLGKIRNESEFDHLFNTATTDATSLGLKKVEELDADSRRTVRGPVRYEMQTITGRPHVFTEKERIRSEYYSAVDLLYSEIERRFDQPGLAHMSALEGVLSNTTITDGELVRIISVYDDIDQMKVLREIRMLPDLLQSQSTLTKPKTASEWAIFFASQPETVRHLFRETVKIVQILLVVPATAASAERSFSSLRRLKTWLRRTMTQKRLTHLALLHCHRERADKCDIEKLCHAFACKTNERRTTFGL